MKQEGFSAYFERNNIIENDSIDFEAVGCLSSVMLTGIGVCAGVLEVCKTASVCRCIFIFQVCVVLIRL